jgi:hypothetical protein
LRLELQHLVDGGKRLVARLFDESACVHHDEIRPVRIGDQAVSVDLQQAQHPLAVHQILGTTETHKSVGAFGGRWQRNILGKSGHGGFLFDATGKKRCRAEFL